MKNRLIKAYTNPTEKFCFYTGQNDAEVGKALGIGQWDWTPQSTANIEPYFWNTHTIALAFGCPVRYTSEGKEWIDPLITKPEQVHDIPVPEVGAGRTGEILRLAEDMLQELPDTELIRLTDIQSPLGVAELLWDQSFYMALLTNPDEIKVLLDKITCFIIDYVKTFQVLLGKRYNPACHPQLWSDPAGYYISDDVNAMVSPDMHYELSIAYIKQITEACGPVFYHTCTLTDPYVENVRKVKNKKALNWSVGTSMDPARIIERFSGEVLLAPHLGKDIHKEEGMRKLGHSFTDEVDVFCYFLDSMLEHTTMNIVIHESLLEDPDKMRRIYRLFSDRGYAPSIS
jgi:hypothetical protein